MTKIIFFADAHLDRGAWATHNVSGDSQFALAQIVDHAISIGADAVIGAGDLIDKQRNRAAPIQTMFRQLDRLRDKRIPFYYIQGQHDMDDPPWLSAHGWAQHIDRKSVGIDSTYVYGLDWRPAEQLQEELPKIAREADILVAHQCWSDWMGEDRSPQGAFADVPTVHTVVSGDLHNYRDDKKHGKDGQSLRCISPGATNLRKINEPTHHGFIGYRNGCYSFMPLRSRAVIDWGHLLTLEDVEHFVKTFDAELRKAVEATADLPEALRKPLLRVTYGGWLQDELVGKALQAGTVMRGGPNAVVTRVEETVKNRCHVFWKELPKVEAVGAELATDTDVLTPLSALAQEVDVRKDPEAHGLLQRLLQAEYAGADVAGVLAGWQTEYMQIAEGD